MSDKTGSSETFLGWMIILAVVACMLWILWHYYSVPVMGALRWVKYWQLQFTALIFGGDHTILWHGKEVQLKEILELAKRLPASRVDGQFLALMSKAAFMPFRWVIIAIIGLIGIWAYTIAPMTRNRKKFGLDDFIKKQSKTFKIITPFIRFNPSDMPTRPPGSPVPAELPLFSEALGPEEWLAYTSNPMPDGQVDEAAAQRAFAKQLGKRWRGSRNLEPYKKILLAAFCLKAARRRNEADEMLGRLAVCWSHDKGLRLRKDRTLLRDARKVLKNRDISRKTLSACNQHAWEHTALMRALTVARENGGVLAPAQFVWLRGHDRELWYPLNNVGRQSFHMEALGAMAHYKAEKMTSRPIPKPKVDFAVQSIVEYMSSPRARPIPKTDYKGSKKRGIKKLKTT